MTAMLTVIVYLFRAKPKTLNSPDWARQDRGPTIIYQNLEVKRGISSFTSLLGEGDFNPST